MGALLGARGKREWSIRGGITVSPKRKYTLLPSRVLRTEGVQMESRGCAKHSIELVQPGPSLILKFKEMAAHQEKP